MPGPTIQPVVSVETIPFLGLDGTSVGSVSLTKNSEGKKFMSAFNGAENFLYRIHKTVVNDMKKENPNGQEEKKEQYRDMFQDWTKEHEKTEVVKATGGKKSRRKTKKAKSKKAKKRSRRTKINKK